MKKNRYKNIFDWDEEIDSEIKYLKENENYEDSNDVCERANIAVDFWFGELITRMQNLNNKVNDVICIADLGLWNGHQKAYRVLDNLSDILTEDNCDSDNIKLYWKNRNIYKSISHHDGTNCYLYRERKENISDEAWENFKEKLYNNEKVDLNHYTKSLEKLFKENKFI